MVKHYRAGIDHLNRVLEENTLDELVGFLQPKKESLPQRIRGSAKINDASNEYRWGLIPVDGSVKEQLLDPFTRNQQEAYQKNIENFIGTVKVPVGLVGPLRVNGIFAQGDFLVPLATTEAALIASYNRGAQLITETGGCTTLLVSEGVCRAPGFCFKDVIQAGKFVQWCLSEVENFRKEGESTTRYGKMIDMKVTVEGNHVFLNFEFLTGDASGQNMVTIATDAIMTYIINNSPVKPEHYFIEANLSGDKKATTLSFHTVRGKKVTAEVHIDRELIKRYLHTTPEKLVKYCNLSSMGGTLSGTIGIQGHYANGLAAIYLACGQDVACVAESAIGCTRFEITSDGQFYASVTLPNLIVGTVGGGTGLPSQNACLEIMGLAGAGKARAFAELCAAVALAGELSITGAICAQHFCRAHNRLARGKG